MMRDLFSIVVTLIVSIKTYSQLPLRANYSFITEIAPSSRNSVFLGLGVLPYDLSYLPILILISLLVLIITKATKVLSSLNEMQDKQEQLLKKSNNFLTK